METEDMIAYWDGTGCCLATVKLNKMKKGIDLTETDKLLLPIMKKILGESLDNSSYEFSSEWE